MEHRAPPSLPGSNIPQLESAVIYSLDFLLIFQYILETFQIFEIGAFREKAQLSTLKNLTNVFEYNFDVPNFKQF